MIRKIAITTFIFVFLCLPMYVLGAPPAKSIEVFVNGSKVETDTSPIISDGRTLVPLRVISENLGAGVHWNNKERSVTVTTPSKNIVLKINDKKVKINNTESTLDVPAKIVNNRTMVPLRFIGESLGAKVNWNDTDRRVIITRHSTKIVDMSYEVIGDKPCVVIKGDTSLEYTAQPKTESNYLAIDVKARLDTANNALYIDNNYLNKAVIGEISNDPPLSRLVLELKDESGYTIYQPEDKCSIIISFVNTHTLNHIDIDSRSRETRVNLEMSKSAKYNYFFLPNPDRLVLDIEDTILAAELPNIPQNQFISDVRIAQFSTNPNTVRVVFDLKDNINYKVFDLGNDISVSFSEASTVEDIDLYSDYDKTVLEIAASDDISYEIKTDKKNKQIKLLIPGAIADKRLLEKELIDAKDGIVDFVQISKEKGYLEITTHLYSFTGYKLETQSPSSNIKLVIYKSPLKNRLIVIDPGHGGSEPGAVVGTLMEKDLNLDISLKLKKLLEENGARVQMTREGDIFVDLYTRAGIANEIDADLFISIHNNSAVSSATGTETLYYPDPEKKALASAIQKAIVANIGLRDRGIVERPGLVVTRETKMPSALVEVAFMTNSSDRQKLMTDDFRQKAAEGIYEGIINYLTGQD